MHGNDESYMRSMNAYADKANGSFRNLAIEANVAANGRWGVLAMVAISIAAGELRLAFLFAMILFAAHIAEQLPARFIRIASVSLTVVTIVFLIALVLVL